MGDTGDIPVVLFSPVLGELAIALLFLLRSLHYSGVFAHSEYRQDLAGVG